MLLERMKLAHRDGVALGLVLLREVGAHVPEEGAGTAGGSLIGLRPITYLQGHSSRKAKINMLVTSMFGVSDFSTSG